MKYTKQQRKDFAELKKIGLRKLRTYLNERLNFTEGIPILNKVTRIYNFTTEHLFFEAEVPENHSIFENSYKIQSVGYYNGRVIVTFYIKNDIHGYGSILSEINFWRNNQEHAEKRNITVV